MYAAGHKAETYVTKTLMNCFPTFQTLDVAVLFWMYKAIQHCTSLTHAHVTVPCPESLHCFKWFYRYYFATKDAYVVKSKWL